MTETTKTPAIEKHEYYRDIMAEATTLVMLSSIRTEYSVDPVLIDVNREVLKVIYDLHESRIRELFTAQPGKAAPAYQAKQSASRVAKEHKQDDEVAFGIPVTAEIASEVFPDIEILTTNPTTNTNKKNATIPPSLTTDKVSETPREPTVTPDSDSPSDSWPNATHERTPKATPEKSGRKTREVREWSVTLSREIKLPIDGVQFSNNLFGVTLTAWTYAEAKDMMEEAFADFTSTTKFLTKDDVAKAHAQWVAEWKKIATPTPRNIPSATKAEYKNNLDRARAMILQLCEVFPEAKQFAQQFATLNPMVQENPIV